ncbi:ATP-binding protein [Kitasatospora purpeofusca]|uniref:ATP-binding protein n=1 Tax=Kitasatospora purpeofusca TaxID=67352 RepID=UPI003802E035
MHRVLMFKVPARLAAVGPARDHLLHQLTELAGIRLDDDRRYALRVCSSEAMANGIEHGGVHGQPPDKTAVLVIEGDLDTDRQRLRITISDGGLTVPEMTGLVEDLDATSGRGLAVISGYADAFGWGQRTDDVNRPTGFSVWFEVDVQPLSAEGQATARAEVQPEVPSARRGRATPAPARIRATGHRHLARVRDGPSNKEHLAA